MTRAHASFDKPDAELESASWAAARGATVGAAKWAVFGALAAGVGQALSPTYRGLTFQFKVFLQMSFMTFGSVIEADKRLREHGRIMRYQRQLARDGEVWRRYQQEYAERDRNEGS